MFLGFILLLIIGIMFLKGHDVFSKIIGVLILCCAFNTPIESLTGRSIWGNIQTAIHTGDKVYTGLNDTLKSVNKKVTGK
jgi:hypothetical protein